MKKKILAAILTAAMTIGMVGCGSTSSSDNGNNSASNTEASSNELTVWCWDATFNIPAMEEAEKIYQKDHPDVNVNVVETSLGGYSDQAYNSSNLWTDRHTTRHHSYE